MLITDEKYLGAAGNLPLQKILNIRDYAAGIFPAVKRIPFLQETAEHVYN